MIYNMYSKCLADPLSHAMHHQRNFRLTHLYGLDEFEVHFPYGLGIFHVNFAQCGTRWKTLAL